MLNGLSWFSGRNYEDQILINNHHNSSMNAWHLYLIRCRDNSLYTGITKNVNRRLEEHRSGGRKGAKYLRGRAPLTLVWQYRATSQSHALKLELRIKQLPKYEKERLVSGQLLVESLENTDTKAGEQNPG